MTRLSLSVTSWFDPEELESSSFRPRNSSRSSSSGLALFKRLARHIRDAVSPPPTRAPPPPRRRLDGGSSASCRRSATACRPPQSLAARKYAVSAIRADGKCPLPPLSRPRGRPDPFLTKMTTKRFRLAGRLRCRCPSLSSLESDPSLLSLLVRAMAPSPHRAAVAAARDTLAAPRRPPLCRGCRNTQHRVVLHAIVVVTVVHAVRRYFVRPEGMGDDFVVHVIVDVVVAVLAAHADEDAA
eukprot:CAMPEP_0194309646 /NCGR_PEP_ID=MMETSP0171-20130528/6625_1 /TAXON_ID=218684 /ORGANISM="Corethron pennatum, Strain L29A3" /LENGTH=240 /DNA_ID=CAMNT_0039062901 /DNA_START=345 /DNA_END=1065 /DNA_ORIENTATION=-